VSKFGLSFNGGEDPLYNNFGPAELRNGPEWEKYALSLLEFRALSGRPGAYTIGQGDVPAGSEGDRMGGSLLPLLVVAICSLCTGLYQVFKSTRNLEMYPLIDMGILLAIVAVFPGSYDLRYFSFVEITLVAAALLVLQDLVRRGNQFSSGLLSGFKFALVGSALFVSSITGFHHIYPTQLSPSAAVASVGADASVARALLKSEKLCYVGPLYGFLYSKVMHPEIAVDYSLTVVDTPAGCPAGSALID
jgi:hypothetical protein